MEAPPGDRGALLSETESRRANSTPANLQGDGSRLPPLDALGGSPHEGIERYGYRSFDRQWIIADARVIDAPKRPFWNARGPNQVFLTTLTSTKLGDGPTLTVTPYVPDLDRFRGSYGAKNAMPLYRDSDCEETNITQGLLASLREQIGIEVNAEDLLAYVYALGGTAAFASHFVDELG